MCNKTENKQFERRNELRNQLKCNDHDNHHGQIISHSAYIFININRYLIAVTIFLPQFLRNCSFFLPSVSLIGFSKMNCFDYALFQQTCSFPYGTERWHCWYKSYKVEQLHSILSRLLADYLITHYVQCWCNVTLTKQTYSYSTLQWLANGTHVIDIKFVDKYATNKNESGKS